MSDWSRRWGVPFVALALFGGVWGSLRISASTSPSEAVQSAPEVSTPETLEGFHPAAWFLPDDDLLGFVEIPAGPFLMGSDPAVDPMATDTERWSRDSAQGMVDLPTFYISRYEVTVAQFLVFVRDTGFRTVDDALRERLDHPMGGVTWMGAVAYARWLDEKLRLWPDTPPALARLLREGWTIDLPSEAEWEKAARGDDGRIYPWGSEPRHERANFGTTTTTSVGSFDCPECPYGLADMGGNVWEWTRSPYEPYPFDPSPSRVDLDGEALWVMRGGSYADDGRGVRAAERGVSDPGARRPVVGFRLAISPHHPARPR